MKKSTLVITLMLSGSVAWAAIITDDFNRADTAYSTDMSLIGANWATSHADGQAAITSNTLNFETPTTVNRVLYNTGLSMTSAGADSWTMSSDVTVVGPNVWGGVAFNVQDADNYYAFRSKMGATGAQIIKVVNGSLGLVGSVGMWLPLAADTAYTYTITSTDAYTFGIAVTEVGSSVLYNGTTSITDTGSNFDGGYGGFYHNNALSSRHPDATYDNFSVTVIPEPATIGLLGMSALGIFAARKFRVI